MPSSRKVRHCRAPPPLPGHRRRSVHQLPHAAKTYMVVDRRHDHSFRVPRPDLSTSIGTPNACTECHTDHPAEWAARAIAGWYPQGRERTPHYGTALFAGRTGAVDAEMRLDQLILDRSQPDIARASALLLLPRSATPASDAAIKAAIADPSPIVRSAVPRSVPSSLSRSVVEAVARSSAILSAQYGWKLPEHLQAPIRIS